MHRHIPREVAVSRAAEDASSSSPLPPGAQDPDAPEQGAPAAAAAPVPCLVVSPRRLLAELLCAELQRHTRRPWQPELRLARVPPLPEACAHRAPARLLLWDGHDLSTGRLGLELAQSAGVDPRRDAVALFNLLPGTRVAPVTVERGVRGVFFADDSLAWLLQGVAVLLQGQVWLSGETVAPGTGIGLDPAGLPAPWNLLITRREREVLELLVAGQTNQEIAEALSISPHTAKTHLYKLYKKINVSSRLEAVIWYRTLISG